eukprot:2386221-Rhodomonas_salina.2
MHSFFEKLWAEDSILSEELEEGQTSFCRETFTTKPAFGGDLRLAMHAAYHTCLTDLENEEEL